MLAGLVPAPSYAMTLGVRQAMHAHSVRKVSIQRLIVRAAGLWTGKALTAEATTPAGTPPQPHARYASQSLME